VRVIPPGGPYFKWPWERVYKVSVATQTVNMAFDPEDPRANSQGTILEAVTKDQLNTGLTGQIRYRISEKNLYAYIFGVKRPIAHVMGYLISVLRERIATFEAPKHAADGTQPGTTGAPATGISINDLRKNLRDINDHMDVECSSSAARYGITLDATLITGIDPPPEVESALAAINTAYNQVSSDISLAPGGGRPEDRAVAQSRGDRNPQGPHRGRAAGRPLRAASPAQEERPRIALHLHPQCSPATVHQGPPHRAGGSKWADWPGRI
jgi:regulator of protease activity HflC (stomatin/prohibitin superfamily)